MAYVRPAAQGADSCETCVFWGQHTDESGACQRYPQAWQTTADYWCGEYQGGR